MYRKMGTSTLLPDSVGNRTVEWILAKGRVGFTIQLETFEDWIQKILKESNKLDPFTDDCLGIKWLNLFLERHQQIAKQNIEIISKSTVVVTEKSIRYWFVDVF